MTEANEAGKRRSGPRLRAALPLEHRLALLISLVLIATVVATVIAGYRSVQRSTFLAATDHLRAMASELANLTAPLGTSTRARQLAENPLLVRLAATGDPKDSLAIATALRRARNDPASVIELWAPDGSVRAVVGSGLEADERAEARTLLSTPAESTSHRLGPLYGRPDGVFYLITVGIVDGPNLLGHVVERRRLQAQARVGPLIQTLSGEDVSIYVANQSGDLWTSLGGSVQAAPVVDTIGDGVIEYARPDGGELLAAVVPMSGTPWQMVVELPKSGLRTRTLTYLRSMAVVVIMLVVFGAFIAWTIGRRIARPIKLLTSAATDVAQGDLTRRVHVTSGDEVGRLSATFNTMAGRVEESYRQLEEQALELQAAAGELEIANRELHRANTELANHSREAETARAEAVTANKVKADFLAAMSHELRTPLNAILGFSSLLLDGVTADVTDAQREHLTRIRASGQHLLALIDEILLFARVEAGKERLSVEQGDAFAVAREAADLVVPAAQEKGLVLRIDIAETRCEVTTDLTKVRQILLNLISNAVKFTVDGGVRVSAKADALGVVFLVSDTGIGIASGALNNIFEPFYQVEQSKAGRVPGTGLGLSVSRRLARLLGGDITVTSVPGAGSAFELWVPRVAPLNVPRDHTAPRQAATAATPR